MKHVSQYAKPYRRHMIAAPLIMMMEVLCDLYLPFIMSYIINFGIIGISPEDDSKGSALASFIIRHILGQNAGRKSIIILFASLMLLVTLIGGAFGVLCSFVTEKAAQGFGHDLRLAVYDKIMSLSIEEGDEFTSGSLITRITNDVTILIEFTERLIRSFIRPPMFMLGGIVMLFKLKLTYGFTVLFTVPILASFIYFVLKRAIPIYKEVQARIDKINKLVEQTVVAARLIKAYGQEENEEIAFDETSKDLRESNYKVLKLMATISPLMKLMMNFAIIIVILTGCIAISKQDPKLTTGAIMAAITYATQAIRSLIMASNLLQTVSRAGVSAGRLEEVLLCQPDIVKLELDHQNDSGDENEKNGEINSQIKSEKKPHLLEFDQVSFRYKKAKEDSLKNVSFFIDRGETFGIIGSTGCGKTSLVNLIPRLYDPSQGRILLDGQDIRSMDTHDLRTKIGYAMQHAELFTDTVKANILMGLESSADEGDLLWAIKIARVDEFLDRMPHGIDSEISEKGMSVSGGQKQRIALARALISKPDILILDDATSALDLVTEEKVQMGIRKNLGQTSLIIVAQRVASIIKADRIAVMENDGTIKHIGNHAYLMEVSETYRQIYQSQIAAGEAYE